MDTKKAIEFVESFEWGGEDALIKALTAHELVKLLERGEKFEAICEEIHSYFSDPQRQIATKWILGKIEKIEQKYFPKPI